MKKVATNIDSLDRVLSGGLPKGSVVIFEGPPGIHKGLIASQIFCNRVKGGDCGLYITTDKTPDEIYSIWKRSDYDLSNEEKLGSLRFIDAYSKNMGVKRAVLDNVIQVPNPQLLIELGIAIKQSNMKLWNLNTDIINLFDSISTTIMFLGPADCGVFFQMLIGSMKQQGIVSIFVLDKGMHDPKVEVTLEHFADIIFEFKKEDMSYLRISGSDIKKSEWMPFEFSTEKGLVIHDDSTVK